ncbi:MAG: hypothetical protein Q9170_004450 [Blastenia crenularia]
MLFSAISTSLALFTASVVSQQLTKPPLQPNLDNLKQGFLNNLSVQPSTRTAFTAGQIPSDCQKIAQREGFAPADIQTFNVKYNDVSWIAPHEVIMCLPNSSLSEPCPSALMVLQCSAVWIFCYHKNSNGPVDDLINTFGRLPVHTRQFVRHVVSLPASGGHAYNDGGNIVFFGVTLSDVNVHIHESAHSLDLLGAFSPDKPLSGSTKWTNEYNQDSAVPDPYSQTNQVENVAQNTVVCTYERNVPGGFFGLNPDANKIYHQYATIDTEQRETDPRSLLVPGGTCTGRLANSSPVPVAGAATAQAAAVADVALPAGMAVIKAVAFNTNETCHFGA